MLLLLPSELAEVDVLVPVALLQYVLDLIHMILASRLDDGFHADAEDVLSQEGSIHEGVLQTGSRRGNDLEQFGRAARAIRDDDTEAGRI